MKQLKKFIALLALALLLIAATIYALENKDAKQDKPNPTPTVTQHEEGSAACLEKHAKGECKGHEPGQPHMEKGDNPGNGYAEGSAASEKKHAEGKCKGHESGKSQHEEGKCKGHEKPNQ